MTAPTLPASSEGFAGATWDDILPYYTELASRPLTADTIDEWLRDWSTLEELVGEAASLAMIAYTVDTADPAREAAHLRFSAEILPKLEEQSVALAKRLVESGWETPATATMLRRFRTSIESFREANVPLAAEIEQKSAIYQKITGGMTAPWQGEELPLPQLTPFLKSHDRAVREQAFRGISGPYMAQRDALANLFDELLALRQQSARNAGFANYRDYIFPAKYRFDYTPADCVRFHEGVEQAVAPVAARILDERRRRLGIDTLRPWDLQVDPWGREETPPAFRGADEFAGTAQRMFARVSPAFGSQFRIMIDERLLDLESRRGKAPGGYCDTLHHRGRPFIFMNAVGIVEDVMTLLHEAGHAFHAFEAHEQPLLWQRHPGSEMAELASMSMELLAAPYLARPEGYFDPVAATRARLEHFEDVLVTLAHIASVDAFQHWIYTDPAGADGHARDRQWLALRARFEPGVDWSGLERERVARWYRQLHIFLYPFYYIEYGIAQLGALQVWRNSLQDRETAVRRYREALALGATRSLPELYAAAGARLIFDADGMAELAGLVEQEMERLRAELPA